MTKYYYYRGIIMDKKQTSYKFVSIDEFIKMVRENGIKKITKIEDKKEDQ